MNGNEPNRREINSKMNVDKSTKTGLERVEWVPTELNEIGGWRIQRKQHKTAKPLIKIYKHY
ncbi:MAG: hypothetical protein Rhims3KO_35930 [Hyphomicrobiales bacterium]